MTHFYLPFIYDKLVDNLKLFKFYFNVCITDSVKKRGSYLSGLSGCLPFRYDVARGYLVNPKISSTIFPAKNLEEKREAKNKKLSK